LAKYVILYKFTDQGARNIADTVHRAEQNIAALQKRGISTEVLLWTQGEYDLVTVGEAPDEATMMASLLSITASGNVRSTTLRAFDATEMTGVIEKMQ